MKKYMIDKANQNMTRDEERNLAIELLDDGFFWLNNTMCKVCSIEGNGTHYFINYEDRIGTDVPRKNIIVTQLREVGSHTNKLVQEQCNLLKKALSNYKDYEEYIKNTPEKERYIHDKEEFDFLKEVLS